MIDVTVTVILKGAGLLGDADTARNDALAAIEAELKQGVATFAGTEITPEAVTGLVTTNAETYEIAKLSYLVAYEDDGVRINQRDVHLPLTGLERLWIRSVALSQSGTGA
jgi:hypothetical protein